MKKIGAFVAAVAVVLGAGVSGPAHPAPADGGTPPGSPVVPLSEDFTQVAASGFLRLGVDLRTANLAVWDSRENTVWYANPPELEGLELSQEMLRQLQSQLIITFVDAALNEMTVNSQEGCVQADTFEVRQIANGVRIVYDFAEAVTSFRIPVEITLADDYVQASIVYPEIEEYGTSRLTSVSLLPYFGAGESGEDGYALVPDGSGALIRFSDSGRGASPYNQPVYGSDPSVNLLLKSVDNTQSVRLPVFGMQKAGHAFLAVIHAGAAAASIRAESDGGLSPYTAVNSAFIYHQQDLTGIRDKESNQRTVLMLHDKPTAESPEVRYYFLEKTDADYSGMARRYQRYLEEETDLRPAAESGRSVSLQFFGKTSRPASFLGIPYQKSVAATTFAEVEQTMKALQDKGVNGANILLYGFEKGGYENRYPFKAAFDKSLGGKAAASRLQEQAKTSRVFMVCDLVRDYGGGMRLFSSNQYAKSLNKVNVVRRLPLSSTWDWDEKGASWRYVSADSLRKNNRRLLDSLDASGVSGVLLQNMGGELYSDFDAHRGMDRGQLLAVYRACFEQMRAAGIRLAADGANGYMAGLASLLLEVPSESSGQDLFSETVPFYSMVYHGYTSLASQPVNLAGDPADYLLTLLETGIQPAYWLTGCDPAILSKTPLKFLFNTCAENWIDSIAAASAAYTRLHQGLEGQRIRAHSREGDLSLVTYENGVVLAANHGGAEQSWQGRVIPAGEAVRIETPAGF